MFRLLARVVIGFVVLYILAMMGIRSMAEAHAGGDDSRQADVPACFGDLVFDPASGGFLTSDSVFERTQAGINCYAWQMFVAMNWPVSPDWPADPSAAGEPDRSLELSQWGVPEHPDKPMGGATVWISYKNAEDIFLPDGREPSGWGVTVPTPPQCTGESGSRAAGQMPVLGSTAKLALGATREFSQSTVHSDEIMEATGGWLTDQNGNLVYFQRKVGKAEFDYIVNNGLYNASWQHPVATNADDKHPAGLSLPTGAFLRGGQPPASPQPQEKLGAIELKAAWRILTSNTDLYGRYLTSEAWLQHPETGKCSREVMGLVGLHIIHKTPAFADFVWATFEHEDNVPEPGQPAPPHGYSFHNPDCKGKDCKPNQPRIACTKSGQCKDLFPRDEPVQVTRVNAIPDDIQALNQAVRKKVSTETKGKSVFQHYELVNVLWDQSAQPPQDEPGAGAKVPLNYGTFKSAGQIPVANTTMETYVQNTSCNACHASATIVGSDTLASDFSFLFGAAQAAPAGSSENKTTREDADEH